jgi:ATP-dependent Lon protease
MTGEVTLRGRVLPIGGLKEKVLAAYREGIKTVLFPKGNEKDLPEISKEIRKLVRLVPVVDIDEVFSLALRPIPPKNFIAQRKSSGLPRPH